VVFNQWNVARFVVANTAISKATTKNSEITLAINSAKQSIYQRNIWWFSILLEFFRCLCVYLVVKGVYLYTPSRPQQRKQERFDMPEPQTFAEKKTSIHIPTPTVVAQEMPVETNKSGGATEYAQAIGSMRKIKHDIKRYVQAGNEPTEKMVARWNDGQERLRKAAEALGESFKPETMPKLQTNP